MVLSSSTSCVCCKHSPKAFAWLGTAREMMILFTLLYIHIGSVYLAGVGAWSEKLGYRKDYSQNRIERSSLPS